MFYFSEALRAIRNWDPGLRILGTSSFVDKGGSNCPVLVLALQPAADELELFERRYFVLVAKLKKVPHLRYVFCS